MVYSLTRFCDFQTKNVKKIILNISIEKFIM